ncbi:uncharacterized protein LOC134190064 [Corticium candelabrum]|uniref:uncharacterized protein LOC134190064 n=1 Tax=Corticium candelabrum TaxID=121492 RepID=UPI002E255944|nr:uncharacterized protein LOC134190064 [Corticium candelabrum]
MGVGVSKGKSQLHDVSDLASHGIVGAYMNDEAVANMMARRGSLDLQHLRELACTTHFSYKEIEMMYAGFRKECRTGEFSKRQFINIYSRLHSAEDSEDYCAHMFRALDTSGNGSVDFDEFVSGLSCCCRGSLEEKLNFSFRLQDINRDGHVTKEEMIAVVCALCKVLDVKILSGSSTVREHVEKLFDILDTNRDGYVTIDDFLAASRKKRRYSYDWVTTSLCCHVLL